jgi:hypothetical protein
MYMDDETIYGVFLQMLVPKDEWLRWSGSQHDGSRLNMSLWSRGLEEVAAG